jgi:hypothetical protein
MSKANAPHSLVVTTPSGQRFRIEEPSSLTATNEQRSLTPREQRLSDDYRITLATQEGHARLSANADDIIAWHKDHIEELFVSGLVRSEDRLAHSGLTWMQPLAEGMIIEVSQQTKLLLARNHEALGFTVTKLANQPLYPTRQQITEQVRVGFRDLLRGHVTVTREE